MTRVGGDFAPRPHLRTTLYNPDSSSSYRRPLSLDTELYTSPRQIIILEKSGWKLVIGDYKVVRNYFLMD